MSFIENWRAHLRRAWSIRLAGAFATVGGLLIANPTMVLGLIAFIPTGPARFVVAGLVALVLFGIPTITALIEQRNLGGDRDVAK